MSGTSLTPTLFFVFWFLGWLIEIAVLRHRIEQISDRRERNAERESLYIGAPFLLIGWPLAIPFIIGHGSGTKKRLKEESKRGIQA